MRQAALPLFVRQGRALCEAHNRSQPVTAEPWESTLQCLFSLGSFTLPCFGGSAVALDCQGAGETTFGNEEGKRRGMQLTWKRAAVAKCWLTGICGGWDTPSWRATYVCGPMRANWT